MQLGQFDRDLVFLFFSELNSNSSKISTTRLTREIYRGRVVQAIRTVGACTRHYGLKSCVFEAAFKFFVNFPCSFRLIYTWLTSTRELSLLSGERDSIVVLLATPPLPCNPLRRKGGWGWQQRRMR